MKNTPGNELIISLRKMPSILRETAARSRSDNKTAMIKPDNVSVLMGQKGGTFAPAVNYMVGDNPLSVVAADINGDKKIDFIVECNPLLGPQLMELTDKVVKGEDVPKRVVTEETTFTPDQAAAVLADRQY